MVEDSALATSPAFAAALMQATSCGVLVIDTERRIRMVNSALARSLGMEAVEVVGRKPGAVLRCVESLDDPERCGLDPACEICSGRKLLLQTLAGEHPRRALIELEAAINGTLRKLTMPVTATPFRVGAEQFAILVVEDLGPLRARTRPSLGEAMYGIVGQDPKILALLAMIRRVAASSAPVLIQGESGTGKELVANAIHSESPRADRLFVPVNCGALSEGLLESELFGHVKGAFTGALREKRGRFQLAHRGSLFLDEVGELAPAMQVRFLRVLQTGSFEPVGSERSVEVDVRIICATNRDLEEEVASGRFREDLYYRLNVVPLRVPPLRERREDIPGLARHLLATAAVEDDIAAVPVIAEDAMRRLTAHGWPGNVRELENALRFAILRCEGGLITARHLPPGLALDQPSQEPASSAGSRTGLALNNVEAALRETHGNKVRAARALGVSRATLYRFLDEHDLTT